MWILLAAIVILAAIAYAVAPKANVENARAAKFGDFQFPRSKYGDPVPVVWGTVRLNSPLTIWWGDYSASPIRKKVKTGLASSKHVTSGFKNRFGIDVVLCLGPGVKLRKIWAGPHLVLDGVVPFSLTFTINRENLFGGEDQGGGLQGDVSFYAGNFDESQDEYLAEKLDPNVPAYQGFARCVFKNFYIGTSTTPPPFNFEVQRLTNGVKGGWHIMPNGLDANPIEVAYDLLTGTWGQFAADAVNIDALSFENCAETLYNEELGISLAVQSSLSGRDVLEEVMRIADGVIYQDPATAKLKAKLIRNDYVVSELPVFDESSVLELKNFQKTTWQATLNQCRVTFKDRSSEYNSSVAITQDAGNMTTQGRVKSTEISVPGCCVAATAAKLAARQLALLNVPLYKCDLVLNRKGQDLRPGDVFVLNWKPFNLTGMIMRVTSVDFGSLTNNAIRVSCIQDKYGSSNVVFSDPVHTNWTGIDNNAKNVTNRRLFIPPAFLMAAETTETAKTWDTSARLYCVASAPSINSISFDAVVTSGTEPVQALTEASYNGFGTLVNDYSATIAEIDRHDTSGLLVVDNVPDWAIAKLVNNTTLAAARDGSSLLLIDDELLIYKGFVVNGNGRVTFNNVYRGILDTAPTTHWAGAAVWFINSTDGQLSPMFDIGESASVKLLDQTSTSKLALEDATAINGTVTQRGAKPLPPNYSTINGSRTPAEIDGSVNITLDWRNRSRETDNIRVYADAETTREGTSVTRIRWYGSSGTMYDLGTFSGSTATVYTGPMNGQITFLLSSEMNGLESQEVDRVSVFIDNPGPG